MIRNEILKTGNLMLMSAFFVFTLSASVFGQVTLNTSPYTESFDNIGSGLPSGYTVRTGATSTSLGTPTAFTTAQTTWSDTTGNFRNIASADGLTSSSSQTQQNSSTDRAIGLRQSGSFGDPGAAVVLQLSSTAGIESLVLTFKFQTLNDNTRTTTFTVDYGIGSSPTTFTAVSTVVSGGFGTQTITANFGSALNNQTNPVFIRIAALSDSTGSGNRDTVGIDDLSITFTSPSAANATIGGRVLDSAGNGIKYASVTLTGGGLSEPIVVETNDFGYYNFADLPAGGSYVVSVQARRYFFSQPSRVINLEDNVTDANFVGDER